MDTTRTRLVEELFQSAYDLAPEDRARFLDEQCAGDEALRAEVESLLESEGQAPAAFLAGSEPPRTFPPLAPGQRVGRFEILAQLGAGGMGTVYAGRQDHPKRDVALKLIRGERIDAELLHRFRHEADILATLHHPGIAQVYEAGTAEIEASDGALVEQPFFAMELVRGRQLMEHARERQLGTAARAELLARICDAVQHAHHRGVIHRDLKPDNILVLDGEIGQPKVLDFGIARGLGQEARETWTRAGHLMGTLEYMSPEQVSGDPGDVGTQSDVYALGVLLYELLAGSPPFETADVPLLESARRICEEPPRPLREVDPTIPAELQAICLMALEKHEADRYASAGELAADLRRFLTGDPVTARSHSTFYVMRKTLSRHQSATTVGALVLALLVTFSIVSRMQATRNKELASDLAIELRSADIERGRMMARSDNLIAAEELLWKRHLEDPGSRHSFWALWELYSNHRNLGSWANPAGRTLSVAFHPDGELFASAGDYHSVQIRDANGRGFTGAIEVGEPVPCIDFHPGGKLLALATASGRVLVADFETGRILQERAAHDGGATVVQYTHGGERLLSSGADGRILVWDPELREATELAGHVGGVEALALSADGQRLASGDDQGVIHVWNGFDGPPVRSFQDAGEHTLSLGLSADGRLLASGGTGKLIHIRDVDAGTEVKQLAAPNGSVRYLEFRGNDRLISGGWWWVLSWDLETGERTRVVPSGIRAIDFHERDGRIVGGDELRVRLWDQEPRDRLRFSDLAGRAVAAISPDGRLLVAGDEEGGVRAWDTATSELVSFHQVGSGRVLSLTFRPSDGALAVATRDRVSVLDLARGTELLAVGHHHGRTSGSIAFSPAGDRLAHTCPDGVVHVHDASSGELLVEIEATAVEVLAVAFAPDGRLATTARDDRLRLWSREGQALGEVLVPGKPWRPSFSDDGTRLAVTTWVPRILVYDSLTLELEVELEGHRAVVWDAAFAPGDASTLASASDDGTVRLWDVDEARCLATLNDFEGWDVFSVAFGPDNVLAAGGRRAAVLWDLTYYERHMAANLENQLELAGDGVGEVAQRRLRMWAAGVLERPWPRL